MFRRQERMAKQGEIRVGIGGWTYEPWRDNFYPADLTQKRELEYASRHVTAIEINGTFYRSQTPATFAKWRDETPDDFIFTVKVLRYITVRRVLAEAGEAIERFVNSGLAELGDKLGPLLWQFGPTKKFDPEDFERFLKLLPARAGGIRLRHALEARHPSFANPEFISLARAHGAAVVFDDSDEYQSFADLTSDFVYARLMKANFDRLVDGAAGGVLAFLPETARGVALGVAVNEQDFSAVEGQGGGQIDRRGGLSDSTLLICDGDNLRHISYLALYSGD